MRWKCSSSQQPAFSAQYERAGRKMWQGRPGLAARARAPLPHLSCRALPANPNTCKMLPLCKYPIPILNWRLATLALATLPQWQHSTIQTLSDGPPGGRPLPIQTLKHPNTQTLITSPHPPPIPYSLLPIPYSLPIPYCLLPSLHSLLPIAYSLLPSPLPIPYCLLHCLFPIAFSIAYSLFPSSLLPLPCLGKFGIISMFPFGYIVPRTEAHVDLAKSAKGEKR